MNLFQGDAKILEFKDVWREQSRIKPHPCNNQDLPLKAARQVTMNLVLRKRCMKLKLGGRGPGAGGWGGAIPTDSFGAFCTTKAEPKFQPPRLTR